jgi:hypothetical protein
MLRHMRSIGMMLLICGGAAARAQSYPGPVSVMDFGALCNWLTQGAAAANDQPAIQAAINSTQGQAFGIAFPNGALCRITAPIVVNSTSPVSIYGTGPDSGIMADFDPNDSDPWPHDQPDIALEVLGNTAAYQVGETFRDFGIYGYYGNPPAPTVSATGFYAQQPLNYVGGVNHVLNSLLVQNLLVSGFNPAFTIEDVINSSFENLTAQFVNTGSNLEGENVNDNFTGLFFNTPSNGYTSNTGSTTGIIIQGKVYPDGIARVPQGLNLLHSFLLKAGTDLILQSGFQINIQNDIFDLATGSAVTVGSPNSFNFDHNYLFSYGSNAFLMAFQGVTGGAVIKDNFFLGGASGQAGIDFTASGPASGAEIEGNRFQSLQYPLFANVVPTWSIISGNLGSGNSGPLLWFNASGTCGTGTNIEGNLSSDSQNIITSGCSGYHLGYNHSPLQTTGS